MIVLADVNGRVELITLNSCRHYMSCDAAVQANVARHKGDCAEITKKRAKKELLRLVGELLAAVQDLA